MYGKSFVLIKPDGVKLEVTDEIAKMFEQKEIRIIKKKNIFLNISDILNLWPYTQSDIVSRQLFSNYLIGKKCILLQVESSKPSLYDEIAEIKEIFRKKYGRHQFKSVIHTPGIPKEYIKDMMVFEGKIKRLVPNKTIIGSFECYSYLEKCDLAILCQKIQAYLNIDHRKLIQELGKNRWFLVLYKNGLNDSYFLMGILREYLNYSFELSYYLAFSVNYFKAFPILLLDNTKYEISEIRSILEKYSYETIIINGEEYLNGRF